MERKDLEKQLGLDSELHISEKFAGNLETRNYIELRLIADALTDISKSLKTEVLDINYKGGKYTQRIARILQEIATKYKGY